MGVRSGNWNPDGDERDRDSRDALAARGYYAAFEEVQKSVGRLILGSSPIIVRSAHQEWFRALFGPAVTAGIIRPSDPAGYGNHQVYIKGSMHVPLAVEALMDVMTTLVDVLEGEAEAAVGAVLGHFIFVYIHPSGDGNGRLARFLMNTMVASGGYPRTVIQLSDRQRYFDSLEAASYGGDIKPFAEFVCNPMPCRFGAETQFLCRSD